MLISFTGGGVQLIYTSKIANSLIERNEVTAIIPYFGDENLFNSDIKLIKIDASKKIIRSILLSFNVKNFLNLRKSILKAQPDVIHLLSTHPWNIFICLFFHQYPKIFTLHDPIYHETSSLLKKFIELFFSISDIIVRTKSQRLIVHGKTLKMVCLHQGVDEDRIDIIPLGLLMKNTNMGQFISQKDHKNKFTILFFGRIEKYKGIEYFIQAANIILKTNKDVIFLIVGSGDFSKYKNLIQNTNNIKVVNRYIPDGEIGYYFETADVIVLPYISGSQSGVIPVAYSFKKPVIVTNVGSIPEMVDDNKTGLIIPPCDVNLLVGAITKLLNDDDLRMKMGENAHNKLINEMSWENIAKKHIDSYLKAINNGIN